MNPSSPPTLPIPPMTPGRPWPLPVPTIPSVPLAATVPPSVERGASDSQPTVATPAAINEPRSKRRDKVLYVRVNLDEKEQIVAQAHHCRLSISRYLTRLALEKRPPPTVEDRTRIETLLFLFKRTEANVRRLHAEASRMRLFSVVPGIEDDFEATLETVPGLIRELGKRL